ncbi:hypothetical protein BOTBODRAFT_339997 [Botryobasidium botryosum FD-172 SS1]|uniref:SPX domain-containing protein n=1 Tax=Botryobasidium botryosum (strain FD-172 SS1) TaxID=930990 RepID=A0A067MGV8_BOTB1|nr:hypothetical protein BOTBODRAFT_339997 [Botryobasidium botryosum FD-172 SS1]
MWLQVVVVSSNGRYLTNSPATHVGSFRHGRIMVKKHADDRQSPRGGKLPLQVNFPAHSARLWSEIVIASPLGSEVEGVGTDLRLATILRAQATVPRTQGGTQVAHPTFTIGHFRLCHIHPPRTFENFERRRRSRCEKTRAHRGACVPTVERVAVRPALQPKDSLVPLLNRSLNGYFPRTLFASAYPRRERARRNLRTTTTSRIQNEGKYTKYLCGKSTIKHCVSMQFGKIIQSQQVSGWSKYYLDYKSLKKIVSSLSGSKLSPGANESSDLPPLALSPSAIDIGGTSTAEPGDLGAAEESGVPITLLSVAGNDDDRDPDFQRCKAMFFFKLERELEKVGIPTDPILLSPLDPNIPVFRSTSSTFRGRLS